MRFIFAFSAFFILILTSCEEEKRLEDHLYKTWDLEWKRCEIYLNAYNGKINFNETDSVDDGWFLEQGEDTVNFEFVISNSSQIEITKASDDDWLGTIHFEEFGGSRIVFERENKACDKELWRFK